MDGVRHKKVRFNLCELDMAIVTSLLSGSTVTAWCMSQLSPLSLLQSQLTSFTNPVTFIIASYIVNVEMLCKIAML